MECEYIIDFENPISESYHFVCVAEDSHCKTNVILSIGWCHSS